LQAGAREWATTLGKHEERVTYRVQCASSALRWRKRNGIRRWRRRWRLSTLELPREKRYLLPNTGDEACQRRIARLGVLLWRCGGRRSGGRLLPLIPCSTSTIPGAGQWTGSSAGNASDWGGLQALQNSSGGRCGSHTLRFESIITMLVIRRQRNWARQ